MRTKLSFRRKPDYRYKPEQIINLAANKVFLSLKRYVFINNEKLILVFISRYFSRTALKQ